MSGRGQWHAPDIATFEALSRAAVEGLPPAIRERIGDVVIRVEDFADAEQLAAVGLDDEWELTGLYTGTPLTEKSAFDAALAPDIVHLFRQPLLAEWCETGADLGDLIRHVVIHEIGHHFGLSDEAMHVLEDEAE